MKDLIQRFEKNGFVYIPKFLEDEELKLIEDAIEEILDEALEMHQVYLPKNKTLDDKWLYLKKNYPQLKSRTYDLIKHLNQTINLSTSQKIHQYIYLFLGNNYLIDKPQIRFDDNEGDRLLPMHQEVYGQLNYTSINVWIPFMDTKNDRGGLAVIPGSHKLGPLPHQFFADMNNSHGVKPEYLPKDPIIVMDIKAGDALFFDSCLIHGSTQNKSNEIRKTFVARYNKISGIPYLQNYDNEMYIPQTV